MGDYCGAEALYLEDLSIIRTAFGDNHPDLATTLNNLAGLHGEKGDLAKAETLYLHIIKFYLRAIQILKKR